MVANRDEQVMVKDIFGIDVDIYEGKWVKLCDWARYNSFI